MKPLRDVKKGMEREVWKGSCPLMFDRLEFDNKSFHFITSEEKLDEALAYLLRVKSFRQYEGKTIINNVYMDLGMLRRIPQFKRTHSFIEREGIYAKIQRYKKRLQPDYDGGLCMETAKCVFTLPEGEAEKYRITYNGQETYAFIMSNRDIMELFARCEKVRKSDVSNEAGYKHLTGQEQKAALFDGSETVLFQTLLFDAVEYENNELSAGFHTIYCLNKKG